MGKKYIKYIGNLITGNIPIKYYGLPICICHLAFLRSDKTDRIKRHYTPKDEYMVKEY